MESQLLTPSSIQPIIGLLEQPESGWAFLGISLLVGGLVHFVIGRSTIGEGFDDHDLECWPARLLALLIAVIGIIFIVANWPIF